MIWEEFVKLQDQQGIYFFQLYSSKNRQGRETSQRVRLDKHSTAAHLVRFKRTCKGLKGAIERSIRVAITNGEQLYPITISTQSGETQVHVNVKDIICFGFLNDDGTSLAGQALPTERGCIALPRSIFQAAHRLSSSVPAQWSWIRRIAISFDLESRSAEAYALAGPPVIDGHDRPVCYSCIAWNLSGLRSLEEIVFIVEGLPKPTEENPYGLLTKISTNLYIGPNHDWTDMRTRCDDFPPVNNEEKQDHGEFETGKFRAGLTHI